MNRTPIAEALNSTLNKYDPLNFKSSYKANDIVYRTKQQPTDCVKIFTKPTSDRDSVSKIDEELKSQLYHPWHIPKDAPSLSQGHLLIYVHCSFIHNIQELEIT